MENIDVNIHGDSIARVLQVENIDTSTLDILNIDLEVLDPFDVDVNILDDIIVISL